MLGMGPTPWRVVFTPPAPVLKQVLDWRCPACCLVTAGLAQAPQAEQPCDICSDRRGYMESRGMGLPLISFPPSSK